MSQTESHTQIEDIIDARNESGQYDALCNCIRPQSLYQTNQGMARYAYSTPGSSFTDDIRDNIFVQNSDQRNLDFGPTDSEITLCRVKRVNSHGKKSKENNNWDIMHDSVIPGDGTHLGESPSLVNLVTLVVPNENENRSQGECLEYLVPLSSWEPAQATDTENQNDSINNRIQAILENHYNEAETTDSSETVTESTVTYKVDDNLNKVSENSLISSKSVEKQKSTSSVRGLFKRMAFWKRKSKENIDFSLKCKDSSTSTSPN